MNQERFEGICKQLGGKVKERWGRLTGDPRHEFAGLCEQRAGRNQARYGVAIEEAESQLKEFLHRNRNWEY